MTTSPGGPPQDGPPGRRRKRPHPQDYKRKYRPTPPKPCEHCGLEMEMLHPLQRYHWECKEERQRDRLSPFVQKAKKRKASAQRAKRKAVLGRQCEHCLCKDHERAWSLNNKECARCHIQVRRKPCAKCGGPRYHRERWCARCTTTSSPTRLRVIVQDANSDRERPYTMTLPQLVRFLNKHPVTVLLDTQDFVEL